MDFGAFLLFVFRFVIYIYASLVSLNLSCVPVFVLVGVPSRSASLSVGNGGTVARRWKIFLPPRTPHQGEIKGDLI